MDADLVKIEEMVMKGEEVTSTEPSVAKLEAPYQAIVIPQPPVIQSYQHESLQCFQCFITFCNAKAKERHMKKSHREEYKQQLQQCDTLFTCYVCDRTFPSSEELTNHQSTHNKEDKPFKCTCKESFRTFSELTSHRRQQCPERQFQCKDCGITYRSPGLLRNHRLASHAPASDTADPSDATKFHRCAKCNAGFSTEAELLEHQENHAGSEHCNGGPPAKRPRGRPPKAEKPAKQKKEATAAAVEGGKEKEEDAATAEDAKPEAVKGKPKKETTAAAAAVANKRGRPPKAVPKKAHPCGECEESFAKSEQLEVHMTRVHTEGRYTCPTCSKSFSREGNLKAHQQSHTKEKEVKKKPAGRGRR